jgi:hypothetical protein
MSPPPIDAAVSRVIEELGLEQTQSNAPGTTPVDQLVGVLQLPLTGPFHKSVQGAELSTSPLGPQLLTDAALAESPEYEACQ